MRVLITGAAGLLGRTLIRTAPRWVALHATQRHSPVVGAVAHVVELSDRAATAALWESLRPDLVIHTAYSMGVGERDIVAATESVVAACRAVGSTLIHLSSDALFDGEGGPYRESDEPTPCHEYGRWKARAEQQVRAAMPEAAIVRTSLLTEFAPLDPRSAWVAEAMRWAVPIKLYVDELRCPITPHDLAQQLWEVAALPTEQRAGVWHLVGPEVLSRYALGLLVAAHQRLDGARLTPALSRSNPAPRPRALRLLTDRADRALRHRPRPISTLVLEQGAG